MRARSPAIKSAFKQLRSEALLLGLDAEDLAMVENIGANLGAEVRPTRNALEAGLDAHHDYDQLVEETEVTLTPREERNLQFSFEAHLRAMARSVADKVATEMGAKEWFATGEKPEGPVSVLKLDEYSRGNYPNLGPDPASERMAIPIPPGMEDYAPRAAEILKLKPEQRKSALAKLLDALTEEAQL